MNYIFTFFCLGVFGFLMMSLLLVPFYYIEVGPPLNKYNSRHVIEDFPDAITQIMNNKWILLALIGINIMDTIFTKNKSLFKPLLNLMNINF